MGRLIFFLITIFAGISVAAQDTTMLHLSLERTGVFTDMAADNAGNIYIVTDRQQVKKLNSKGDSLAVYNDVKRFGTITSLDVTNPLKILLFYKGSGTVVILDRFLATQQVIDLRRNKIQQASAIRLSYDNNIWVYDELESKIRKIDDSGKTLFESADLRLVFSAVPAFNDMFDDSRSLFLYHPQYGWYTFDYYGAFVKKQVFTGWQFPQVTDGKMLGVLNNKMVAAATKDLDFASAALRVPVKDVKKMVFISGKTYVLYTDSLKVFDAP